MIVHTILRIYMHSHIKHQYYYTVIFLGFLFHIVTICSKSLSDKCSGDSIATFIRWDKFILDNLLRRRHFSFILENLRSTDAVVTGIVRQTVPSDLRLGYMAPIISFVTSSCTCHL